MITFEKNHTKLTLSQWLWLFVLISFLGCCFEDVILSFNRGHFELKQGLLFEPLIPIYGIAGCVIIYVFNNIKSNSKVAIFIVIGLLGAFLEYIFSFIQEKIMGTISWDYSNVPFNIDGRTMLYSFFLIGLGGYILVLYIYPYFIKKLKEIPRRNYLILTWIIFIIVATDLTITNAAAYRQTQRREGVEATTCFQMFFDKYYPDEWLDEIFKNARVVK